LTDERLLNLDLRDECFFDECFLELDLFFKAGRRELILTKSWGLTIGACCLDFTFVGKLIIKLYNNLI
jgi:hypothetical protein